MVDWILFQCNRDESCYCALDGVCLSERFTSELEGVKAFHVFELSIEATSRSGLKSKWEKNSISVATTERISLKIKRLTPASKTMNVEWSINHPSTGFLVIACRKDLETAKECVTCFEVSVKGSQREAEVKGLRPNTIYRVQIEALDGNRSVLSAPSETKTLEDSKCTN